jgi:copper chaperone CopZ
MEKLVLTLPTLYGDHHTTAVRDILEKIDGVSDVYASSSFNQVSLSFDPKVVKKEAIETALADQGYRSDDPLQAYPTGVSERVTRHTAAHSGTGDSLAFAEATPSWEGRPLWPCPGIEYRSTN